MRPGLLALVISAAGCAGSSVEPAAPAPTGGQLDAVYAEFSRGYAELDAELVAGLYTEDALYLPPDAPIRRGRAAIREGFAASFERARDRGEQLDIAFERTDRRIDGDLAYEVGIFTLTRRRAGAPDRVSRGKFTVVLYRDGDGAWRFHVDSYSGLGDEPSPHMLAFGEPYLTELAAALHGTWNPPDGVAGEATACLRLGTGGTVTESWVWPPSGNAAFDASVQAALDAVAGPGPVPAHLVSMVTEDGICLRFRRVTDAEM